MTRNQAHYPSRNDWKITYVRLNSTRLKPCYALRHKLKNAWAGVEFIDVSSAIASSRALSRKDRANKLFFEEELDPNVLSCNVLPPELFACDERRLTSHFTTKSNGSLHRRKLGSAVLADSALLGARSD